MGLQPISEMMNDEVKGLVTEANEELFLAELQTEMDRVSAGHELSEGGQFRDKVTLLGHEVEVSYTATYGSEGNLVWDDAVIL